MALEMERQRLTRRAKEVETALSEALWSGKTTIAVEQNKGPSMRITHSNEASIEPLNSTVPYCKMVRSDVLDFTERPKTVSAVPHYLLYDQQNMAPLTAVTSTDYEVFGETDEFKQQGHKKQLSQKIVRHEQPATSPISRVHTLPNLRVGGHKRGDEKSVSANSRIQRQHKSDTTTITSNSSWTQLDPVLYQERARTSWGREKKKGKVRIRNDPPGFKRAMLTSKGHPGIFNMDPLDEDMTEILGKTI